MGLISAAWRIAGFQPSVTQSSQFSQTHPGSLFVRGGAAFRSRRAVIHGLERLATRPVDCGNLSGDRLVCWRVISNAEETGRW